MRGSVRFLRLVAGSLMISAACPICAPAANPHEQQSELMTLLARPILAEGQSLNEVRRFCDGRVAVMPKVASWSGWQHEAEQIQRNVLDNIVFRGVPPAWRDASRRIEWLDTIPSCSASVSYSTAISTI